MPLTFNPFTGNFDFVNKNTGPLTPNGSTSTPNSITAVGGISVGGSQREVQFVKGSGGPVTVTANPQIQAGTVVGQELILIGTDDTNTVTLSNGTGLLLNGTCILANGSVLSLIWTGSVWNETSRNDI